MATILEEQGNDNEAYGYAINASKTFENNYGELVDMTLTARWQHLGLAYKLRDHDTLKLAKQLYIDLIRRDSFVTYEKILQPGCGQDNYNPSADDKSLYEECERHVAIIRKMTIATIIMEYIRRLPESKKKPLHAFCDAVVRAQHNDNELIYNKVFDRYHLTNQKRVESVTNLKIKHNEDADWLRKWYEKKKVDKDKDGNIIKEEGKFFKVLEQKVSTAI